jgi:hypothetical protein
MELETNLIRVTELLRWGGIVKPIPDLPRIRTALKRGTAVHEWSLKIEDDDSCIQDMPSELQGYGSAIQKVNKELRPNWKMREQRIDDVELGITGCPDRCGLVLDNEFVVLDYKTGQSHEWHKMQLAIYSILIKRWTESNSRGEVSLEPKVRLNAYLKPDGTFAIESHLSRVDMIRAWSLINRWREYNSQMSLLKGENENGNYSDLIH